MLYLYDLIVIISFEKTRIKKRRNPFRNSTERERSLNVSISECQNKALTYFREGYICAQAILLTMQEYWKVEHPLEPKVACAFGSGIGRRGSLCGAVTGGVIAISWKFGTNEPSSAKRQRAYALALKFYNHFVDRCGSAMCRELIGYDLTNSKEAEQARQSNVYQEKCTRFLEIAIELLMKLH